MGFDLNGYLGRIEHPGSVDATLETLRSLHLAHATTIPFENLDIHLGRPIKTDVASVYEKLVQSKRGGYCFEHNALFAAALEEMGFSLTRLGARVGTGDPALLKRTHMILQVHIAGTDYLADVGFGSGTLFEPIPIAPGGPYRQFSRTYRVGTNPRGFVLQQLLGREWNDLYHFTLEEMYASDYVVANHYTSTHPESGFVRVRTAQRQTTEEQWILRGSTLTELRDGKEAKSEVEEDDLLVVLANTFGLSFPAGTRFRSPVESSGS